MPDGLHLRSRHVLVAAAALAAVLAAALLGWGLHGDLALLERGGPVFLLFLPLCRGSYPGERVIAAIGRRPRRARARRPLTVRQGGPGRRTPFFARGGLLLAAALGRRGPPLELAA